MAFEFNVVLGGSNCHIRANYTEIISKEIVNTGPHKHFSMEFHCVFSGEEIVELPEENRKIYLTSGTFLLLPTDTYHSVYTEGTTVERICFNFSAEPLDRTPGSVAALFLSSHKPRTFAGREIALLADQCRQLCAQPRDPVLELRQGIHFLTIALHLMHTSAEVSPVVAINDSSALRQRWIIEEYITQHFRDNTGIEGLSNALFLSQRQTSTLVKQTFGENFKSLIIRRRMEVAKIYLQTSEKSLEEIAYAVGYRSYSGFELCFKRFFGITPQSARNKWITESRI